MRYERKRGQRWTVLFPLFHDELGICADTACMGALVFCSVPLSPILMPRCGYCLSAVYLGKNSQKISVFCPEKNRVPVTSPHSFHRSFLTSLGFRNLSIQQKCSAYCPLTLCQRIKFLTPIKPAFMYSRGCEKWGFSVLPTPLLGALSFAAFI